MSTVKTNTIEPASGGTVTITGAALTTPALGTPASGTLTNCTGLPASSVVNTPAGGISATTVQGALEELDSEKVSKSGGTMTDNLTFTSGKGIDFSATPGTGTSELLDDYEEGTWTPTVYGSGTAGTYTLTIYNATYTKVGQLVTARADFTFSAASGGTGNVRIDGLPFSYSGQRAMPAAASTQYVDTTTASGLGLFVNQTTSGTSTELFLFQNRDADTYEQVPISGISTNTRIAFVLSYEV